MNPVLNGITTQAQKVKLSLGAWLKVNFADEPIGTVLFTLDVPGAYAKYLNFEVHVWIFSVNFCLLAVR